MRNQTMKTIAPISTSSNGGYLHGDGRMAVPAAPVTQSEVAKQITTETVYPMPPPLHEHADSKRKRTSREKIVQKAIFRPIVPSLVAI